MKRGIVCLLAAVCCAPLFAQPEGEDAAQRKMRLMQEQIRQQEVQRQTQERIRRAEAAARSAEARAERQSPPASIVQPAVKPATPAPRPQAAPDQPYSLSPGAAALVRQMEAERKASAQAAPKPAFVYQTVPTGQCHVMDGTGKVTVFATEKEALEFIARATASTNTR